MATYRAWNDAIAAWFTVGQAQDTRIFLSVDESVIEAIGRTIGVEDDAVDDFLRVVRDEVVRGYSLDVKVFRRTYRPGAPWCTAFLAACVLAASRMQHQEDRDVRDTNFFSQLRDVLGLLDVKGRPDGLTPQDDERHWEMWAKYLSSLGLHSTARPGTGAREYVEYPISQTLLREADKDRIAELFDRLGLGDDLDPVSLLNELSGATLHPRIVEMLESERRDAVIDAMHDLYEGWRTADDRSGAAEATRLYAGLYRTVDFLGNATWLIYPREPKRQQLALGEATRDGERFPLSTHRPGFLCPIAEATSTDLDEGTSFDLDDGGSIVLPARDYWILVSDPQGREDNVFASWGAPTLGSPFVVLTRKEKLPTFHRLEVDGLICVGSKSTAFDDDSWWVLDDCLIVSESATSEYARFHGIAELRPSSRLSISISGGIRAPGRGGWMEEHGPDVAVVTFDKTADVTVTQLDSGDVMLRGAMPTGERLPVELTETGRYRVEARVNDTVATREFDIVEWESLASAPQLSPPTRALAGFTLCGARIGQSCEGELEQ